jgi:glycosyltransferase involved in cell wall biosynthesis
MKPRIIWIIDSLGPGGAENLTLSIMKQLDRDRYDFRVCFFKEKHGNPIKDELLKIGIPVDMVHMPNLRHPANLPKLIKYLRTYRPQVIHTQLQFANILGNIAAAVLGMPSISTLHTVDNPVKTTSYWRNQITWFVLRNLCSKVIAVSENTRQFHISKGKIPEDKIVTIYNGIDISSFRPLDKSGFAKKRRSLNLPPDGLVFTTIAVLRKLKGIQFMIEAMPEILKLTPDFRYLIVGDGEYGETLKKLVSTSNLGGHVVFTGQRKDIPEILAISDVFVLPTLTEALPTVLIEAMAAQKAIIASNVGGVPEMVENEKNGLLVPPADPVSLANACSQLAQDTKRREAMAKQGYLIAHEKFEIKKLIHKLNDLYDELIKNGR